MKSGSVVVKHQSSLQGRLLQFLLLVLVVVLIAGMYFFGQYRAGHNQFQAKEVQRSLETTINTLQADKAELRDRLALVEQSTRVDKQAYQQVKDDLRKMQQENLELREEVSFYRGIVAPRESSSGIRVDSFDVQKSNDSGLYHYKIVITQVLKNERSTRGKIKAWIAGVQGGKPKDLTLESLAAAGDEALEFKFRYFQKFEGDIQLPKGFAPREVKLEVHPFKRKIVKASFPWPETKESNVVE